MPGFTNLLFCLAEDDNAAVRYVARLSAATSADLTIADVIEDIPPIARRLLPSSWNLPALVRTQKQARLESSAAVARRLGARTESRPVERVADQGTCAGSRARRTRSARGGCAVLGHGAMRRSIGHAPAPRGSMPGVAGAPLPPPPPSPGTSCGRFRSICHETHGRAHRETHSRPRSGSLRNTRASCTCFMRGFRTGSG